MADFEYSERVDGASGTTNNEDTTNPEGTTTNEEEEPIENKWNDLTGMFEVEDEPMRMNDDTPSVEIYISHEKVWQKNNDGEYDWDGDTATMALELTESYMKDDDANDKNTSVVKVGDTQVAANNAIDNLTQNDINRAMSNQYTNRTSTK